MALQLVNHTPYGVGYLLGQVRHPAPSLTIVIKGTFDLRPGGPATVASEQLPLSADTPEQDDVPVSLRYPADLVHFKPRADVLLVGSCHAGPEPALRQKVSLRVGDWSKSLSVTGDRFWEVIGASSPVPFRSLPLDYERAFGGAGSRDNPVGRGLTESSGVGGMAARWLPNVEDPERLVTAPGSRVAPAGFGPLRREWAPRADKLGTYDARWLESRWPWYPEDFDWSHHNAAPEDMQLPYLRGDEALALSHLHEAHAELATRLPGTRVRCFVAAEASEPPGAPVLREVQANLDTLWIDAEALKLVLVWRAVADVASAEADEVKYLYVSEAPLAEAPAALRDEQARFDAALAAASEEEPAEELGPELPEDDTEWDAALATAEKEARAQMQKAGIDPDHLPAASAEETQAHMERLRALGFELDDDEEERWTRERVSEQAARAESFAGQDLSRLDLSGLDLTGADFTSAVLAGVNLSGAVLESAIFDGALLASANLSEARLSKASFRDADLTEADLSRATGVEVVFEGALLESARLPEVKLERLLGARLSAPGADLSKAALEGAVLREAQLSSSKLEGACLRGADLTEATLEAVRAARLDARGATLTGLRAAEGSHFAGARFDGCAASGSNWQGARLAGASFYGAVLDDANLSGSDLEGADLAGASLRSATLRHAKLKDARLSHADLFQAILEGVDGRAADFSHSSLFGAETWKAELAGARVATANLTRTKLLP
jgi:uncharacterized protein YjbI with pentapeptide repeats